MIMEIITLIIALLYQKELCERNKNAHHTPCVCHCSDWSQVYTQFDFITHFRMMVQKGEENGRTF